jgi:uncharacterized protein (TIGR00725 family)
MRRPVVAVMGASEREGLTESEKMRLGGVAEALGATLAQQNCLLVSGATTGLPDLVCRAFRSRGGFALGISPASNGAEHVKFYGLPDDAADVIVYTGFGLKGRNVISVRSADIVLIFGGATGTLNEFTIAYDEGKIIGILEGSGGIADHMREIIDFCRKPTRGVVVFDRDPAKLTRQCFDALNSRTAAAR